MKEEFLADGTTSTEGQNKGKITGKDVDNYRTGVVKVMPTTESASKLQSLIAEKNKSVVEEKEEKSECEKNCGCGQTPCITYGKKEDKKEVSAGERRTYRELLKAKLRAMGMKNPLIMNMEPGEEETMKAMTSSSAKMAATCEETEQLDEFLGPEAQKRVDKLTKSGQNLMKRLGVDINTTPRGTTTKADQDAKVKNNQK